MKKIKNFVKKFIPLTIAIFNREISFNRKEIKNTKKVLSKQQIQLDESLKLLKKEQKVFSRLTMLIHEQIEISNSLNRKIENCEKEIYELKRIEHENKWGIIFNNTISSSEWLTDKSFSLGRWAIGYPCAYILYRAINEMRPKKILELGLGQSTKMTAQYVSAYEGIEHFVVEHDEEWSVFCKNNFNLSNKTEIVKCDWKFSEYDGVDGIREYDGFNKKFKDKKFDLIVIDAPLGGDMPNLARIDILKLLPDCLEKSFVIMLDDYQRSGEKNTFNKMHKVLENAKVEHKMGRYSGEKDVGILVSMDFSFLCSL